MTQTVILECSNGKKLKKNHSHCSSAMMGKTQKLPKGYTSGFVPGHGHAVETVGETEGFGSSCRADSEDSCTPKRKCMSLNVDQEKSFIVPIEVHPTSKMSRSEKKDLEMKLRGELEKIKTFQKNILSRNPIAASGVALSSSTDKQSKKQGLMQGMPGGFKSTKQIPPSLSSNSTAMIMKQCDTILKNLMRHNFGWVFNKPVDAVKLKIPDYFTIIKHPMDLGTIKKKLASGSYSGPQAFASDVRLTFTNAMTYNPSGNDVHIMADTLNKMFEKRWKPIGEKLAAAAEEAKRGKESSKPELISLPKKRKSPAVEDLVKPKSVKRKMPFDEKRDLGNRLHSLLEDLPDRIVDFLRQQSQNVSATDEEIEIDIESFSDDALYKLRKLLDDSFSMKPSVPHAKLEPCEVEMLIESGVSNSSTHPCRVNEPADEDVDIGGDDPPVSIYPPLKIEKDTAPRSSSASSSSDSSSSSSGSDSVSSSGSESDVKAGFLTKSVKGNGQPAVTTDLENTTRTVDTTGTVSGMDQQEWSAHRDPIPAEADRCQGGESATSERQVSPDKLYRAAILRSRFADTILKAHEKTLNQGAKDPEKLRLEREEIERKKREEKARLQAEAKAAEIARRKAQADAAAEAKRKRELEREAARQALLQMEKTVEINENSLFIKDLEILGTAHGKDNPSMVHDLSPDGLQSLHGFNLVGGSNPLEQLGLFMKDDDEEEEECVLTSTRVNDAEEGEID